MSAYGWLGEYRLISSQPLTHWHVTHSLPFSFSFFSFLFPFLSSLSVHARPLPSSVFLFFLFSSFSHLCRTHHGPSISSSSLWLTRTHAALSFSSLFFLLSLLLHTRTLETKREMHWWRENNSRERFCLEWCSAGETTRTVRGRILVHQGEIPLSLAFDLLNLSMEFLKNWKGSLWGAIYRSKS